MRLSDSAVLSKRCGVCGKLSVRRARVEQSIDAGGRSFAVTVFANKCDSCGDVQIPLAEARRMERAVAADLAAHGPVSGESFRYMRKVVGLTGGELARLIGVAFETVSKWETGAREVDRASWLVMSFLAADRAGGRSVARRHLEEIATDGRLPKVTTLEPPPTAPTLGEVLELATGRPHYTDKNVAELLQTDLAAVRSGLTRLRKRGIVDCIASHADESKTWELLVDSLGAALVRAAEAGIDVDEEVRAAAE